MSGTGRRSGVNPLFAGFGAGAVIAFVVGLMATINLQYGAPWATTHTLTAEVVDADSMSVGSDVRIAGREVGQVTSIQAAGDHANVVFHVDAADWPLPADTTASVRLATLLGQKYIQLNPGHSAQELSDGDTIGLQRTRPVVDFDQILDGFDKPTRDSLTSVVRTLSAGVAGQEGTLQQLLPDLSDLSVHSVTPTGELAKRDPEINRILINLGVAADQLNTSRDDLAGVIDNLDTVSAALAADSGSALRSYITATDALNITTHEVLGGGQAALLDKGLSLLGTSNGHAGLLNNLDTLLADLIPQTRSFLAVPAGAEPSEAGLTPSTASLDLIYEIGGATSQADAPGNFFLRQYAQSVDACGLAPCAAAGGASPPHTASPSPACIPLVTCPAPTLPVPTPSLPVPTPPVCVPVPLVTCSPVLTQQASSSFQTSDEIVTGDASQQAGYWPVWYR